MTEDELKLIIKPDYSKIKITEVKYLDIKNTAPSVVGNGVNLKISPTIIFSENDNIEEVFVNDKLLAFKDDTGYYEIQE